MSDGNLDLNEPEITEESTQTIEKIDGSIIVDYKMLHDDVIMQSKDVASICGIGDPQIVRNLLQQWSPLLQVRRDDKNRALWSKSDIGRLQELLDVKKKHGFTVKQTLDYYLNPTPEMVGSEENAMILAGYDQSKLDEFLNHITMVVTEVLEAKFSEQMDALRAEIRELKEKPSASSEELDVAKEEIEELNIAYKQVHDALADKADENERLQKINKNLQAEVDALRKVILEDPTPTPPKRKGFLGFFRN